MGNYNFAKTKIFAMLIIILAALIFSSCGADEKPLAINLTELAEFIGEKIDLSDYIERSEQFKNESGIKSDETTDMTVLKKIDETNVSNAEILVLIEAADEEAAKEIENKLKIYKTNKLNELSNYSINPDNESQYYLLDETEIRIRQKYIFFATYSHNLHVYDIIEEYINNIK